MANADEVFADILATQGVVELWKYGVDNNLEEVVIFLNKRGIARPKTYDVHPTLFKACPHDPEINGSTSDGFHTFDELYEHRLVLNAALFNAWGLSLPKRGPTVPVVKSTKHSDGEPCFGGGWFIVVAQLPTGQISYHYEMDHWDLFDIPVVEVAPTYDGHTAADVVSRLTEYLAHAGSYGAC